MYPQSEKAGLTTSETSGTRLRRLSAEAGCGALAIRFRLKCLTGSILSIAKLRYTAFTTLPRWAKWTKPAADSCSTNSFGCSWSWFVARRASNAKRPVLPTTCPQS